MSSRSTNTLNMRSPLQEALMEADRQSEHQGYVWRTMTTVSTELERMGIPYVVVGGIALQHFGLQRSTQDVVFLIRPADLQKIHQELVGQGFARKSPDSRHLRDEVTHVRVEFLIAGEYPGDGKPKSVQFPEPQAVSERS